MQNMIKVAVRLSQLRKAMAAIKKRGKTPHFRGRGSVTNMATGERSIAKRAPKDPATLFSPAFGKAAPTRKEFGVIDAIERLGAEVPKGSREMLRLPKGVYTAPRGISSLRETLKKAFQPSKKLKALRKSPRAQETFNRSVFMHEAAEAGKQPGRFQFGSHRSVKPPLQDINIARTLTGKGSKKARKALLQLRATDMRSLGQTVPGLERHQGRFSRHAIRRIQDVLDRKSISSLGAALEGTGIKPLDLAAR